MTVQQKELGASVEEKLRALYDLQYIDSKVDGIRRTRGELPLEVADLEDEVAGLEKRAERLHADIEDIASEIKDGQQFIDRAKALKKRYESQRENARNNREYDALTKEVEYQDLEVAATEKKIGQHQAQIEQRQAVIQQAEERLVERREYLKNKAGELEGILAETQREEDFLLEKSAEFSKRIEERLLRAYQRIRRNVKNGLAVVPVERGASKGSFYTIPPQRILEIAQRKRLITDEHSGRILVDPALADEEAEKIENMLAEVNR